MCRNYEAERLVLRTPFRISPDRPLTVNNLLGPWVSLESQASTTRCLIAFLKSTNLAARLGSCAHTNVDAIYDISYMYVGTKDIEIYFWKRIPLSDTDNFNLSYCIMNERASITVTT